MSVTPGRKTVPPPPPARTGIAVVVLSVVAIAISTVAIFITVARPASSDTACRTLAWDALPDPAALPSGWALTASNFYVGGVGSSLVGPQPSDDSSTQATVYLQVTCYGNDSHLAMTRSHDAAIASGAKDVQFTDLGDESFATTDPTSSGTAVYLRRGPLVATLAAQSGVDPVDLQEAASAVDDGMAAAGSGTAKVPSSPRPSTAIAPAASSGPDASADASPVHAAPKLEALLPKAVGSVALTADSTTGASVPADDASTQALIAALAKENKTPADLQIAAAYDPAGNLDLQLEAFQVNGLTASKLGQAVLDSYLADGASGVTTSKATISGKPVTEVNYGDNGPIDYLYQHGDVVFDVFTADATVAAQTLALLP